MLTHCVLTVLMRMPSLIPRARSAVRLQAVDQALAFLREKNTGVTPDGLSFGEVIDHFVLGGDETCFLASNGEVKIIGDKDKPKHDLPTGSSRTSITVYRTGNTAGATGPTAFLPPGVPFFFYKRLCAIPCSPLTVAAS